MWLTPRQSLIDCGVRGVVSIIFSYSAPTDRIDPRIRGRLTLGALVAEQHGLVNIQTAEAGEDLLEPLGRADVGPRGAQAAIERPPDAGAQLLVLPLFQ